MNAGRLLRFGGVSGAGLALDYAIYTALNIAGMPAGWANLISAACGVTFVFAVSARHIFEAPGGFLVRPFAAYAVYQALAITVASAAVGLLTTAFGGRYLLGKTAVLPFTFTANYLFMSWLFSSRITRSAE